MLYGSVERYSQHDYQFYFTSRNMLKHSCFILLSKYFVRSIPLTAAKFYLFLLTFLLACSDV